MASGITSGGPALQASLEREEVQTQSALRFTSSSYKSSSLTGPVSRLANNQAAFVSNLTRSARPERFEHCLEKLETCCDVMEAFVCAKYKTPKA